MLIFCCLISKSTGDSMPLFVCLRDKRHVTKDLTLKYDRKRIRLEVNDLSRGLVG